VIPMAATLDGLRSVKYASIRFERKHQLLKKVAQLKHF